VAKQEASNRCKVPVSLLIIEGETEQIFYPIIVRKYLSGLRITRYNLKGQSNTNKQVIGRTQLFLRDNPNDLVRVYCCVDAERGKRSATPLDLDIVREHIKARRLKGVLSVDQLLADPDIESWFFYDIEGIYSFLRAKRTQRNPRKYQNPRSFGKKDLQKLFRQFDKEYLPGKRTVNFISSLNIDKIVSNCKDLHEGIKNIKRQGRDLTNHLFPGN